MLNIDEDAVVEDDIAVDYFGEVIPMISNKHYKDWVIDRTSVIDDMMDMPRVLQKWGAIAAHADFERSLAKHNLEIVEKTLFAEVEAELKASGSKVLKNSIEGIVYSKDEYQEALINKFNADRRAELAKACLSAVYNKREVLKELATRDRFENSAQVT